MNRLDVESSAIWIIDLLFYLSFFCFWPLRSFIDLMCFFFFSLFTSSLVSLCSPCRCFVPAAMNSVTRVRFPVGPVQRRQPLTHQVNKQKEPLPDGLLCCQGSISLCFFSFVRFQAGSGRVQGQEALTASSAAAPPPQKKSEETRDLTQVQERRRQRERDWTGQSPKLFTLRADFIYIIVYMFTSRNTELPAPSRGRSVHYTTWTNRILMIHLFVLLFVIQVKAATNDYFINDWLIVWSKKVCHSFSESNTNISGKRRANVWSFIKLWFRLFPTELRRLQLWPTERKSQGQVRAAPQEVCVYVN